MTTSVLSEKDEEEQDIDQAPLPPPKPSAPSVYEYEHEPCTHAPPYQAYSIGINELYPNLEVIQENF